MRIYGPNGTTAATGAPAARRTGSAGAFTVSEEGATRPSASGSVQTFGGIDALLALQGVEDPTERRRRAVTRGRKALDVLEEIRLALLDGTLSQNSLQKLKTAAGGLKDGSGDPRLDLVLEEIELRVEVELAKAGL